MQHSFPKKVISLFSILAILGLVLPSHTTLAETITISTASTGGVVSGGSATGESSASVRVQNILEGGAGGNVRVNVRVEKDGVVFATSTERDLRANERFEVNVQDEYENRAGVRTNADASIAPRDFEETSELVQLFGRFRASLADMANLVFFFW
jgi:hypothetical protein